MRKSLYLLLFAALASASIVSCTKENLQEANLEENPTIQLRGDLDDPSNSDNPYDYYGLVHNQGVEAYMATGMNDTDVEKVVESTNTLLLEETDFNDYFGGGAMATASMLAPLVSDFPDNMEEVISAGNASSKVQDKLNEFTNYFLEVIDGEEITYEDAYNYIIEFESQILGQKSWTAEEREQLLSVTSVGRYSFFLWSNEQKAGDLSSKGKGKNTTQAKRPWWNWVVIGVADIGGAVVGSAGGPAAGVGAGASASNLANNLTKPDNK